MNFIFKSLTKSLLFKYSNFHEFYFYISTFILIISLALKRCRFVVLRHGRGLESTKFMKVVIFK